MKTVYTVYQITNIVNGKIYVGVHKCDESNQNDIYRGSGPVVKAAVEKYGIENLQKTILEVFDNEDEAYALEAKIVDKDFVGRTDTYNLNPGGKGGWDYVNSLNLPNPMKTPEIAKKVSDSIKNTIAKNPEKYKVISIANWAIASKNKIGSKHSAETSLKQSISLKEYYSKNKSHLFGTTKTEEQRKALSDGWSEEQRSKQSSRMKQRISENPNVVKTRLGKTNSEAHNKALSDSKKEYWAKAKEIKATCPHCGKEGILSGMKRWHFDNCRNKIQ